MVPAGRPVASASVGGGDGIPVIRDGAGDDLLLRRELLEARLVERRDAIQQALEVAEHVRREVLRIEEKQRERGARISARELSQHGEACGMLQDALAHIVALRRVGQMHEQGAHLGFIERTEVVDLEVIVEGRAVVLASAAAGWGWRRRGSDCRAA